MVLATGYGRYGVMPFSGIPTFVPGPRLELAEVGIARSIALGDGPGVGIGRVEIDADCGAFGAGVGVGFGIGGFTDGLAVRLKAAFGLARA